MTSRPSAVFSAFSRPVHMYASVHPSFPNLMRMGFSDIIFKVHLSYLFLHIAEADYIILNQEFHQGFR